MASIQRFVLRRNDMAHELKYIRDVDGLGIPPVSVVSTPKGWRRDGATLQWVSYDARPFTLAFDFRGVTFAEVAQYRRDLMRFVGTKEPMMFEYTRHDGVVVNLWPVYISGTEKPTMQEQNVLSESLTLVAMNPLFRRDIPGSSALLESPLFGWPQWGLDWPSWGNDFSVAETEMTVDNRGDVYADAVIQFIGPAVTPRVENVTTGQHIEVNRSIDAGEVLEISSERGRVDIIDADGDRHNAFNYITESSELLQLAPGVNVISFGSAGGEMGYIMVGGTEYYATI